MTQFTVTAEAWNGDTCRECGYTVKLGNRRTHKSRENWRAYCKARHESKHARIPPPEARQEGGTA